MSLNSAGNSPLSAKTSDVKGISLLIKVYKTKKLGKKRSVNFTFLRLNCYDRVKNVNLTIVNFKQIFLVAVDWQMSPGVPSEVLF